MPNLSKPPRYHAEYGYVLDCAVELGEISPLEHAVFCSDTPAARQLSATLEEGAAWPKHLLRNLARDYLGQLDRKARYVWALKGLPGMEYALKALQERIEFVVQTKVQSDLGVKERLAIRWMDEVSEPTVFGERCFETVHDICPDKVLGFARGHYQATWDQFQEDLRVLDEALRWLEQPGAREQARALAEQLFVPAEVAQVQSEALALPSVRRVTRALHEKKVQKRHARSAIKKALKLLSSFGMQKDVQLLVAGKEVTLSHPDSAFKFVLQPLQSGWLEDKTAHPGGHVPFQLSLLTKEDVFLSRLCVYFDATPVLDQMLALSLFVQSGNEMELLKKANWFGCEQPLQVREILQSKAPALVDKVARPGSGNRAGDLAAVLQAHHLEEAHWAPYKQPVSQWLQAWFAPLKHTLQTLQSTPAPALA